MTRTTRARGLLKAIHHSGTRYDNQSTRLVVATGLGMIRGTAAPAAISKESSKPDAQESLDWAKVRAQFDLAPGSVHFSPFFLVSHPLPVREAIEKYRRMLDA